MAESQLAQRPASAIPGQRSGVAPEVARARPSSSAGRRPRRSSGGESSHQLQAAELAACTVAPAPGARRQPRARRQQQASDLEQVGSRKQPTSSSSMDNNGSRAGKADYLSQASPVPYRQGQTQASEPTASSSSPAQQQPPVRPHSALAGSGAAQNASSSEFKSNNHHATRPQKTTRVRINSTSEQIQDPNWLIRMSQELEQLEQREPLHVKTKAHLRSLRRKLKSTISGASGSFSMSATPQLPEQQSAQIASGQLIEDPSRRQRLMQQESEGSTSTAAAAVKVPVSILKQRRPVAPRTSGAAQQAHPNPMQAGGGNGRVVGPAVAPRKTTSRSRQLASIATSGPDNRDPVNTSGGNFLQQPQSQSQQQSPAKSPAKSAQGPPQVRVTAGDSQSVHNQQLNPSSSSKQAAAAGGQQLAAGSAGSASPKSTKSPLASPSLSAPICAEGQVKVSGWKRNNLLAKTLSHLDEIRGNQRPVFVPTKIRVPDNMAPATSPTPSSSSKQFADIVREAMASKKNQQQPQLPAVATKRTSDGECKQVEQAPVRASSASGEQQATSGSSQVDRTGNGHSNGHRSSSANPWTAAGSPSRPTASQSNGNGSTAASTQQLMSQLLTVNAQISIASEIDRASGSSSSRQFKLQHKNQQVLQNLRRQSNELQATLNAAALHEATGSGQVSPSAAAGRTKDWKRLAGKLALLTTGRSPARANPATAAFLTADSGGGRGPLRLTVSNQETSSSWLESQRLAQKRGSAQRLQLLASTGNSGLLLSPRSPSCSSSSGQRKLSSSSMVAQPVAAGSGDRDQAAPGSSSKLGATFSWQGTPSKGSRAAAAAASSGAAGSSQRFSGAGLEPVTATQFELAPRRSSDSEAYRGTGSSPLTLQPVRSAELAGEVDNLMIDGEMATRQRQPVVVRGDDLLHLLQVTNEQRTEPGASRSSGRSSLQLTGSSNSMPEKQEAQVTREDNKSGADSKGNDAQIEGQMDENKEPSSSMALDKAEPEVDPMITAPTTEQLPVDTGGRSVSGGKRRTDLSWVVKKTSKVVFFHEKLRKMRWHVKSSSSGKQQKQQQADDSLEPSVASNLETSEAGSCCPEVEAASESSDVHKKIEDENEKRATSGKREAEVFMDPTLIGDAIEIFLRSAMQQSAGCEEKPSKIDRDYENEEEAADRQAPGGNGDAQTEAARQREEKSSPLKAD